MFEKVHPGEVALLLVGLNYCWSLFKRGSKETETKKDDQVVDKVEKALDWTFKMAPKLFYVVKLAAATGQLPPGASRAIFFLNEIHAAYHAQFGQALPKEAEDLAQQIAKGMHAEDKTKRLETAGPKHFPGTE